MLLEQAALNKAQVFELLKDIDDVTALVGTDGVDIRINQEGLHNLVLEM